MTLRAWTPESAWKWLELLGFGWARSRGGYKITTTEDMGRRQRTFSQDWRSTALQVLFFVHGGLFCSSSVCCGFIVVVDLDIVASFDEHFVLAPLLVVVLKSGASTWIPPEKSPQSTSSSPLSRSI